jgi:GNAT superfamily N-acetyltransferase
VFVLVDDDIDNGRSPLGFYALSSLSIRFEEVPSDVRRGQSRHVPIPCVLLGQLAVDVRYQKQGLGGALLADAVREIVAADEHVAIAMPLIVGDALNESIAGWYAKYGSEPYVRPILWLDIRRLQDRKPA